MSEEAAAAISTAALILAIVAVVLHIYPISTQPQELPSPPLPAKTQDPQPAAPPPRTPEPAAQPEGPQFPPHPVFASYMTGIEPADILERYNTEPSYRSWFNDHFGALTIRQATGFDAPSTPPPSTPPPEPTLTEPDNSAECNRLLAQLFNVNTPIEEFDRIEAELVANSCSG